MHKDFKSWSNKKESINYSEKEIPYFTEREIWWCSLGVNVGVEIDGKHEEFLRPVIVLRKFNKFMTLVIPITSKTQNNKYYFNIFSEYGKMYKTCLSQIRTISTKRFFRKIDIVSRESHYELIKKVTKMIQGSL